MNCAFSIAVETDGDAIAVFIVHGCCRVLFVVIVLIVILILLFLLLF